jgi:hypothetical protein
MRVSVVVVLWMLGALAAAPEQGAGIRVFVARPGAAHARGAGDMVDNKISGGGAALSATAEAPRAELQADAAAGLPGLPGPHPEGGLLQYPIN